MNEQIAHFLLTQQINKVKRVNSEIVESTIVTVDAVTGGFAELPSNSGSVRLYSSMDCYVEFGDETVTADGSTSIYFPAGTELFGIPTDATHIAVKSVDAVDGTLSVSGMSAAYKYRLTTNAVLLVGAASARVAVPDGNFFRVFALSDCHIEFGDSSVTAGTATSTFLAAGTEYFKKPAGITHVAAIRSAVDGALYVSGAY